MVRIRLRRVGKRKQPYYRVVVADQRSPRDGRFIDVIGQYNPLTNPSQIAVDEGKALEWLRKGAKPSDSVVALLKRTGIWTTFVADRGPAPKKVKKHKDTARLAAVRAAQSKTEAPEAEAPKAEAPKAEAPKAEAPKVTEAPVTEPPADAAAPDATGEPAPESTETQESTEA
jgi:small subunit ribosomal protein S16